MEMIGGLFPYQPLKRLPKGSPGKVACFTLDFELDYGERTGEFNILRHEDEIGRLHQSLRRENIPLSLFVVTQILERFPKSIEAARLLGDDWHTHSHTHGIGRFDAAAEFAATAESFRRHFGRRPMGYRAPMCLIRPDEVPLLAREGFRFSSSVFPSYRPGKYNHLGRPIVPMRYENGLLELPLGVIRGLRYPISASYLKILGLPLSRILFGTFGIPDILVVDSHLHDIIVDPASYSKLPRAVKTVYGIRKDHGLRCLVELGRYLRSEGYTFMTMTELFELCSEGVYEAAPH